MPANSPGSYPAGKRWALSKSTQHNTQWVLFERTHFVLWRSAGEVSTQYPGGTLWKNPLSSFTKCPVIWSQCAQWVLCKVLTTNSQCGSILPQTLKEPSKCPLGTFWSNCWVFCERNQGVLSQSTQGVLCGHFASTSPKNKASLFKMYPLGIVLGTFWKCPPLTCWLWAGQIGRHFLKMTKTYLLGTSLGKLVGTFQKCPAGFGLGEFVGTFWKCSLLTCWVWARWIVS